MVPTSHGGIFRWCFKLQYGVGDRNSGKATVHIRTAAFRCSDNTGFGLGLWFFDACQKFAHELPGGVSGRRASAVFGSLHSG